MCCAMCSSGNFNKLQDEFLDDALWGNDKMQIIFTISLSSQWLCLRIQPAKQDKWGMCPLCILKIKIIPFLVSAYPFSGKNFWSTFPSINDGIKVHNTVCNLIWQKYAYNISTLDSDWGNIRVLRTRRKRKVERKGPCVCDAVSKSFCRFKFIGHKNLGRKENAKLS